MSHYDKLHQWLLTILLISCIICAWVAIAWMLVGIGQALVMWN